MTDVLEKIRDEISAAEENIDQKRNEVAALEIMLGDLEITLRVLKGLIPRISNHRKPNNEPQPKAEQPEGAPLAPAATTEDAPVSGESAVTEPEPLEDLHTDALSSGADTRKDSDQAAPATIKDRILACMADHPDWSARQIAEECETYPQRVYNEASNAGISLAGGKKTEPVQARKPEPAPMPQPEPKRAPTPSTLPNEPQFIPSQRMTKPNGTRFRLREHLGRGKYLNLDGSGLTETKDYSWVGNEKQLLACRVKFPAALDLVEEVVGQ